MSAHRIVIAGGSGFLGRAIASELVDAGYEVVVLTRGAERMTGRVRFVHWDGKTLGPWAGLLDGATAVINLAGRSVNCRYNAADRREIVESRVDSVRAIGGAIERCAVPPKVWIQGASAAIYGDAGERLCDEQTSPGSGFSPETCVTWETTFHQTPAPRTRRVLLRIGFVLGTDGGALATLAALARCFLGGRVGSGRQWVSWIHVKDLAHVILWAVRRDVEGLFVVATPNPVRNEQLMRGLRRAVRRPWSPPVPAWAVRFGSWVLRTEPELALWGRRCVPRRLMDMGFQFQYPNLDSAIDDLFPRDTAASARVAIGRAPREYPGR